MASVTVLDATAKLNETREHYVYERLTRMTQHYVDEDDAARGFLLYLYDSTYVLRNKIRFVFSLYLKLLISSIEL